MVDGRLDLLVELGKGRTCLRRKVVSQSQEVSKDQGCGDGVATEQGGESEVGQDNEDLSVSHEDHLKKTAIKHRKLRWDVFTLSFKDLQQTRSCA